MKQYAQLIRLRLYKVLGIMTGTLDWTRQQIHLSIHSHSDLSRLSSCAKEPETVRWLESNITSASVFYDIGANVGAYSLIAASLGGKDSKVFAFEPSYSTFMTLNENIFLNTFERVITPIHIALSSASGFLHMEFSSRESGAAKHNVSEISGGSLSVPAMSLDLMRKELTMPEPTLIKIDVDGGEWDVLKGAVKTLHSTHLRSVLIEVDLTAPHGIDIEPFFHSLGFVTEATHPRGKGKSTTLFNYIFVKDGQL